MVHGGQEPGLDQSGRKGLCETVPGVAEAGDQLQVTALEVLEATPHHAGGLLAGPRGEVVAIHQGDTQPVGGQRQGRDRAVDPPSNH